MMRTLRDLAREALFQTRLRSAWFPRYDYMFSPAQLGFFTDAISRVAKAGGSIVEIGCAAGATTLYFNRHLDEVAPSADYLCIDTFAGFTKEDVATEVNVRGKAAQLFDGFAINSKRWFDRTMKDAGVHRVRSIEGDINRIELDQHVRQISFCLVDVDLYRPVLAGLEKVLPLMTSPGIIVVDDVIDQNKFDGAFQAYHEFSKRIDRPARVVHGKLGIFET